MNIVFVVRGLRVFINMQLAGGKSIYVEFMITVERLKTFLI